GVDLVALQLRLAGGETLRDVGLDPARPPPVRGHAIELRVNMETMTAEGEPMPSGGSLTAFDPPSGPGLRTDTFGYAGYQTNPRFDSLLAKVVAHSPSPRFEDALAKAHRALCEFRIEGVPTNLSFLQALLEEDRVRAGELSTRLVDECIVALVAAAHDERPRHYVPAGAAGGDGGGSAGRAGVKVDPGDPLAVLTYGQQAAEEVRAAGMSDAPPATAPGPEGTVAVQSPLQGTIVELHVGPGDHVFPGQLLLVMESMKMQHEIRSDVAGTVRRLAVEPGETLYQGHPVLFIEESEAGGERTVEEEEVDLDYIRPDLAEVVERHEVTLDSARPEAVARRRHTGQRTARENVDDLFDEGSFVEYGPLVLAAQAARRSKEELIRKSPGDGMVIGVGSVNGDLFPEPASRVAVIAYDYTVFAGTQGARNHMKTDRMIEVAERARLPVVLFAEGGGGRPGDTEGGGPTRTFTRFPQLSGLVPMVGITSGRCFAGNASVLGCCDVIIATANSNIGMGGPAMIEGGGLGVFAPEEIGPMSVQVPNGVVDIAVADEAEAVEVAKRYLAYFQGPVAEWEAPDQRRLRRIIPENRLRVYNVREVIETIADTGSVLEIREGFGYGMVTSLVRIEGRPVGIVANNPQHLGGAIDSDGSDKAARFMQICDAFDIPVLFLCDTPGIMVGPEIEHTALVRHSSRMFLIGANLDVPCFTIVLRKAYGLGAIAMAGGSYREPYFSVSWPTGEFGGMGLEGMVKLGYREDLAAIDDPEERMKKYEEMVARAYERGKAVNNATFFSIDEVIDPADSRRWVAGLLSSIRPPAPRAGKKRSTIDGW
ncbi:MAG: carboxyl transferase domain-containing protein, partial [Dehalococcoidia bacterium]